MGVGRGIIMMIIVDVLYQVYVRRGKLREAIELRATAIQTREQQPPGRPTRPSMLSYDNNIWRRY